MTIFYYFFVGVFNSVFNCYTLFFIRTSNFRLRLGCSQFFVDFSLKLFLNCSYLLIFPNGGLVARKKIKGAKILVFYCFIQRYAKNLKFNINTVSVNVTSLLITPPAPDGPANSNKSLYTCITSICVQELNKFL